MILLERMNLLGAMVTVAFYVLVIALFVARLLGRPRWEHGLGFVVLLLGLPLALLLAVAPGLGRPPLYFVQVGLLLLYLVAEALLDYVFKVDFRHVRWMTIAYVTIFFAGSGGMLGVAVLAGRAWGVAAIVLFLAMAVLAFVQRAVTGM
jgi:hypothetical protein